MSSSSNLRGHRDLRVFQLAYQVAMDVFRASKSFPADERYSLTDQIRRSSRSVAANIAEGFRKRRYEASFINKLTDSDAEATETQVWLDFARDCGYIDTQLRHSLTGKLEEVGRMLGSMIANPEPFLIPPNK